MNDTARLCVLTHTKEPDRPRPARIGHLCIGHYKGLEQTLTELPLLADESGNSLLPSRGHTGSGRGKPDSDQPPLSLHPQPLPLVPEVSDALMGVRDFTASWSANVVDRHPDRLHRPRFGTAPCTEFLLRWLDWIAEQDWVDDFTSELHDCRRALLSALTPHHVKRVELGACDVKTTCDLLTGEEVTCEGMLEAVVHDSDDNLPAVITCTVCGIVNPPSEWRALSRRLRGEQDPMLTAAQLSQVLQVPVSSLRRWAVADNWRRLDLTDRHGKTSRFHFDDAKASVDARHIHEQEAS